ncbi:MAG: ribonuclease Z [Prevotella sp.]|nr:ribonuclease Z [Prevotella sp.]
MEPFRVHILGCGSALPTLRHYPSAQIVEIREKLFMVDCGEGVQLQLRRCRVRFTKVGHVFISHLHGDHCFGLIGMISTFGLLGRTAKLHVHANEQLGDMLRRQMDFFCRDLGYEVEFHAIDASQRKVVYEDRSLTVETIPLTHRLPTCGFLFREKPSLPHIRRDMIDFYGIPTSQIMNIKNGADWTLEDGTVVPNERLVMQADQPRCYAYCSDTRYMPELYQQLSGVTTLYHESTYGEDNLLMAQKYNHSTARQAAMVARDAGVRQLILGHYSSRYENEQVLLDEAREVFENAKLANELDVFDV